MINAKDVAGEAETVMPEDWLRAIAEGKGLAPAGLQVLQTIIKDPKLASYASAAEIAGLAGVNTASVVRAAQTIGYKGWPTWRAEIRARYIATLSAVELTDVHFAEASNADPFGRALDRNIAQLTEVRRRFDRNQLRAVAESFASASRRLIIASGSYASVGGILRHHATLAGYRSELAEDAVEISNAIGDLKKGDVVFAIGLWRFYRSTLTAMRQAKKRGAAVFLVTDVIQPAFVDVADRILLIPSESASYFVSIVPAISLIEGLCVELALINPSRTAASVAAFEEEWLAFDHIRSSKSD